MKIFPIFHGKPPIAFGLEIRYEEEDAEYLVHMLSFLEAEIAKNKDHPEFIPSVALSGFKSNITKLRNEFEKYPEGERSINGYVSLYFLDATRITFRRYIECTDQVKSDAQQIFEWDEEHAFFPLIGILAEAERLFFPKQTDMH